MNPVASPASSANAALDVAALGEAHSAHRRRVATMRKAAVTVAIAKL